MTQSKDYNQPHKINAHFAILACTQQLQTKLKHKDWSNIQQINDCFNNINDKLQKITKDNSISKDELRTLLSELNSNQCQEEDVIKLTNTLNAVIDNIKTETIDDCDFITLNENTSLQAAGQQKDANISKKFFSKFAKQLLPTNHKDKQETFRAVDLLEYKIDKTKQTQSSTDKSNINTNIRTQTNYQQSSQSAATTLNNQPEVTEKIKLNAGNPTQIEEAQKDKQQEIVKENTHSEPNVNNDNLETIEQSKNNNNSLDASIQSGAEQEREFESVQQEINLDDLNSSDSNEIEVTELNDSGADITETTYKESFKELSLSATEQPQMEDIEIQTIDELDNSQTIDNTDKKEKTKKTQQAENPKTATPNKPNDSSLDQSIKSESAQSPVAIQENVDVTEINEWSEQATESNPTELNSNNQPEIQEEVQQNKIFEPPVDNEEFPTNNHSGVQESKLTPTDSVPNNNFEVQEPQIDNEYSTTSNILKLQETSTGTTAAKTTQNTETDQNSSTSKTKIKNFFKTQIFEPIKLLPTKIKSLFSYLFNRNKN